MNDLQDARRDTILAALDSPPGVVTTGIIRAAARRVADPPPRTELIEEFVTELLRGDMILQNTSNIEGEVRQMVRNLTSRWDAALGVTEDQ